MVASPSGEISYPIAISCLCYIIYARNLTVLCLQYTIKNSKLLIKVVHLHIPNS